MTNQLPLFDRDAARRARDKAIDQVERHASEDWKDHALQAIRTLCRTKPDGFTTDDIWAILHDSNAPTPHEPRALGAVVRSAVRASLIAPTSRYVQSNRPACHRRPIQIWVPA